MSEVVKQTLNVQPSTSNLQHRTSFKGVLRDNIEHPAVFFCFIRKFTFICYLELLK